MVSVKRVHQDYTYCFKYRDNNLQSSDEEFFRHCKYDPDKIGKLKAAKPAIKANGPGPLTLSNKEDRVKLIGEHFSAHHLPVYMPYQRPMMKKKQGSDKIKPIFKGIGSKQDETYKPLSREVQIDGPAFHRDLIPAHNTPLKGQITSVKWSD